MSKLTQQDIKPGMVFGRLTVINFKSIRIHNKNSSKRSYRRFFWDCSCSCGEFKTIMGANLISGNTNSCGCMARELASKAQTKHGLSKTRIWHIWQGLRARCDNKNNPVYDSYGGRGITYQESWKSFESFLEDMENGYSDELTLDRIDNNGNYTKENCRWATYSTQGFNQRKRITNTSGRTGVYWNKKICRWEAKICIEGNLSDLYAGDSFEDAVKAREEAELKYYGFIKEEDY